MADFIFPRNCFAPDLTHYAVAPRVEALLQGTLLHKTIMQFKGWELEKWRKYSL